MRWEAARLTLVGSQRTTADKILSAGPASQEWNQNIGQDGTETVLAGDSPYTCDVI